MFFHFPNIKNKSTSKLVNFEFLVKVGTLREFKNLHKNLGVENGRSKNCMIFLGGMIFILPIDFSYTPKFHIPEGPLLQRFS